MKKKKGFIEIGILVLVAFVLLFAVIFVVSYFTGGEGDDLSASASEVNIEKPKTKEEWVQIYKQVEALLKVEWEFIAAITKQETGMGNNFGNCSYYPPAPSGGHVLTSGNGLRSPEDKTAFTTIAEKLNIAKNTGVSCNPQGSNGGAMGFTQFMPREWLGGDQDIEKLVNHYPNPWNATDATLMAGRLLKIKVGIGVSEPMPVNESLYKEAAGRYYGCSTSSINSGSCDYANSVYSFYLRFKEKGTI